MPKKYFVILGILIVAALGYVVFKKSVIGMKDSGLPPITYSLIDFAEVQSNSNTIGISYPSFLDHVWISNEGNLASFMLQNIDGFDVYMSGEKLSKVKAKANLDDLKSRGWISEGIYTTRNGYTGELFSSDLKAHPIDNVKDCGFGYVYNIPLADNQNTLTVWVTVGERAWTTESGAPCRLYQDGNYKYFKDMVDYVVAQVQPSN